MKIKIIVGVAMLTLILAVKFMWGEIDRLKSENERKSQNIESIYKGVEELHRLSDLNAVEVQALRLTKKEYSMYKKESEKRLKSMGVKINKLEAAAHHNIHIKIPISGKLDVNQDPESDDDHRVQSGLYKDTLRCPEYRAKINIQNQYLTARGAIVGDSIDMNIETEVELDQAIEPIPKHKIWFIKWGVKGFKQTIGTPNPYVKIKYSEYILIK